MSNQPEHIKIYYPPKYRPAIGIVQFIHGMGDHQGRYQDFAEYLSTNGYAVITSDLKGHGKNIQRDADLGMIGNLGGPGLISDIHENTRYIRSLFPNIPYFLIGHGMGAVIAAAYVKKYDFFLDGLILSGMPADSGYGLSRITAEILGSLKGEYYRSKSLFNAVYGTYFSSFSHEGSRYYWLSSDNDVCDAFEKDPKCGFIYTINGYKTYFDLLKLANKKGSWIRKNLHLPIRVIAGAKDPVAGTRHKLSRVVSIFRSHGYDDLDIQLIHGQKHDIYNDIGHERTYDYVLNFLDSITETNNKTENKSDELR